MTQAHFFYCVRISRGLCYKIDREGVAMKKRFAKIVSFLLLIAPAIPASGQDGTIPALDGRRARTYKERELEVAEELERIGPGFEGTALESENGELPADLVEGGQRLGRARELHGARLEFEGRDRPILSRSRNCRGDQ